MTTQKAGLMLTLASIFAGCQAHRAKPTFTVCELSKNYGAYRDQMITVRGVYYYGLREACPSRCGTGPWPSFIYLSGSENSDWAPLEKIEKTVELEAKKGKRFEIRVTVHGRLNTSATLSPGGPCDRIGSHYSGYGHLGMFPAELVVSSFSDIEVVENPNSPYDYANMYKGPA